LKTISSDDLAVQALYDHLDNNENQMKSEQFEKTARDLFEIVARR
jgi:hypothetical protein